MPRGNLLDTPARRAARQLALQDLAEWSKAERRLRRGDDGDALHDFRVTLRRLRSTLRAFRRELKSVGKTERRLLRRLARATDQARNLEVWQRWVAREARRLTRRQQTGVRWLRSGLRRRRRAATRSMQERLAKEFFPVRRELRRLLKQERGGSPRTKVLGVVRRVVREETAALRLQLSAVSSMADRDAAHTARIAGKRLRYLLEEIEELPRAGTVVPHLQELQDVLGELHDAHVFADEMRGALADAGEQRARRRGGRLLPWPGANQPASGTAPPGTRQGLVALAKRLRIEGERRFDRLQTDWLTGRFDTLLAELRTLGAGRRVQRNRGGRI